MSKTQKNSQQKTEAFNEISVIKASGESFKYLKLPKGLLQKENTYTPRRGNGLAKGQTIGGPIKTGIRAGGPTNNYCLLTTNPDLLTYKVNQKSPEYDQPAQDFWKTVILVNGAWRNVGSVMEAIKATDPKEGSLEWKHFNFLFFHNMELDKLYNNLIHYGNVHSISKQFGYLVPIEALTIIFARANFSYELFLKANSIEFLENQKSLHPDFFE